MKPEQYSDLVAHSLLLPMTDHISSFVSLISLLNQLLKEPEPKPHLNFSNKKSQAFQSLHINIQNSYLALHRKGNALSPHSLPCVASLPWPCCLSPFPGVANKCMKTHCLGWFLQNEMCRMQTPILLTQCHKTAPSVFTDTAPFPRSLVMCLFGHNRVWILQSWWTPRMNLEKRARGINSSEVNKITADSLC